MTNTKEQGRVKHLYRYHAEYQTSDGDRAGFRLLVFDVARETEKTYFINIHRPKLKRVPKNTLNAWAHVDKESAFSHLQRRLRKRIAWYHYWIENCELSLKVMEKTGVTDFADESVLEEDSNLLPTNNDQ